MREDARRALENVEEQEEGAMPSAPTPHDARAQTPTVASFGTDDGKPFQLDERQSKTVLKDRCR